MPQVSRLLSVVAVCLALSAISFTLFSLLNQKANETLAVSTAVCLSQNKTTRQLSSLLAFFEGRTLQTPNLTAEQKSTIINFYAAAQKKLPVPAIC